MAIDLRHVVKEFRNKGNHDEHGFSFYGFVNDATAVVNGELRGKYGHYLKDTALGFTIAGGTAGTVGAAITTATKAVSTLVSGTVYPIKASANVVELDFDVAPTAGAILDFVIVDNTNAITLDVNVGVTDFSFWGRDIVFPAGTSKGAFFRLVAVSDGTAVKWASSQFDEELASAGAPISASVNISTLQDGVLYPVSAGAAISITLDETGHSGKRVAFLIALDTFAVTIVHGGVAYWGATDIVFPAAESVGKYIELVSNGTKWSINDAPNIALTGNMRIRSDAGVFSAGLGDDLTIGHDGTNSLIDSVNATATLVLRCGTNDGATAVTIQNNSAAPLLQVTGDGIVRVLGNLNAEAGLDVTVADLTIGAGLDIEAQGQMDIETAVPAATVAGYSIGITAGTGGSASAGGAGGVGGALIERGGRGGVATADNAAGAGAIASFSGGTGGAGSATKLAGAGAALNLYGGDAGAAGAGGGNNGANLNLFAGSGTGAGTHGGIVAKLAEAAGVTLFKVTDSADATKFSVDSSGNMVYAGHYKAQVLLGLAWRMLSPGVNTWHVHSDYGMIQNAAAGAGPVKTFGEIVGLKVGDKLNQVYLAGLNVKAGATTLAATLISIAKATGVATPLATFTGATLSVNGAWEEWIALGAVTTVNDDNCYGIELTGTNAAGDSINVYIGGVNLDRK